MSTVRQGSHSGAGPLNLMSCVRESSPMDEYETDTEKNVVSKRKFWNPKKWFRKKQKTSDDAHSQDIKQHLQDQDGGSRSRSTSELSVDDERRDEDRRHSSSMHPGLSVSHDSVFHPLNSGSSDLELDGGRSSSSLSISQPLGDAKLQSELSSRLRLRKGREDTSEDDEGLPGSPLCGSPAAANDSFLIIEKTANKDLPTKSHSTCSDGSLLSMDDSFEIDEDSIGVQSRHSSKISLHEKRTETDFDPELGPVAIHQLNHSAAHHRVSVRPKRTYGAPRRKKGQLSSALPATPEVNEESSIRSISPEAISREQLTQLYSSTTLTSTSNVSANLTRATENKLKSSSLPVGVSLPTSDSFRQKRSNLLTSGRSQDDASTFEEEREGKLSFFERIFPRRSGKAKKKDDKVEEVVKHEQKTIHISSTSSQQTMSKSFTESTTNHSHNKLENIKPAVAPRMGAASRQRVQPIDIPMTSRDTLDSRMMNESSGILNSEKPCSPEKSLFGSSPIQTELENVLRQRMSQQKPSSPLFGTPPMSPRSPQRNLSNVISKMEHSSYSNRLTHKEIKREESKTSSLQDTPFAVKTHYQENKRSSREELSSLKFVDVSFKSRFDHEEPKQTNFNDPSILSVNTVTPEVVERLSNPNTTFVPKILHEEIKKSLHNEIGTQITSRICHQEIKSSMHEATLSHSECKKTTNEDLKSRVKIAGLSSLQQKVLSLNEDDQNDGFKSLTDFSLKPSKPVSKSHSFRSKLEETSLIDSEDDQNFEKRKSLKAASLDSLKNFEEVNQLKELVNENKRIGQIEMKYEKLEPDILEIKNLIPNFVNKGSSFTDAITISGPSHTAIVNITSSEDIQVEKVINQSEDATIKNVKESNISVTKINSKHDQTQITRTSVTLPKQEVPEFLIKQLNKVEVKPTSNVVFSMKSPRISNSDEKDKYVFDFNREDTLATSKKTEFKHLEEEQKSKPKPQFLRAISKQDQKQEKPGGDQSIDEENTDKTKPVIIRANSKENLFQEKAVNNEQPAVQIAREGKSEKTKPVIIRADSKENSIQEKLATVANEERLLLRPKTLFNFSSTSQESTQKSTFLRNTSIEDTSPKENISPNPKTLFNIQHNELESSKPVIVRSISKESANLESFKDSLPKTPPLLSFTPLTPTSGSKYKKNEIKSSRKSSIINSSNPELNKSKSVSLDSLRSSKNDSDKSSQDSLDQIEKRSLMENMILRKASQDSLDKIDEKSLTEGVILRRKSLQKRKDDEQPELMKVFARRSLKLKDEDIAVLQEALTEQTLGGSDQKLRDSDKENNLESPVNILNTKEEKIKEETVDLRLDAKNSLAEAQKISDYVKNSGHDDPEVQLRRPFNHNIMFLNQRAQSLNPPRNFSADYHLKKQTSLKDNRKTENWITVKKSEEKSEKQTTQIIEHVEETKTETKNFSQRKAEWEKRVQQFNK